MATKLPKWWVIILFFALPGILVLSVTSPQTATNLLGGQTGVIVPATISVSAQVLIPVSQTVQTEFNLIPTTTYQTTYQTSTSIYVTTSNYVSFASTTAPLTGGSWIYDPISGTLTISADPSSVTVNFGSETSALSSPAVISVNDFQDSHIISVNQNHDTFHGMKVAASTTGQRIKNIAYDSTALQVAFDQTGTVLLTIQVNAIPTSVYADNQLIPEATESVTTTVAGSATATATIQIHTTTNNQVILAQSTTTERLQDRLAAPKTPKCTDCNTGGVSRPVLGKLTAGLALVPMQDGTLDLLLPLGNNQVILVPANVVTIAAIMSMVGALLWYSRRNH